MKENTLELSFEMYEELKETLIKTLRTELAEARSQPAATIDTDAIKHLQIRILQLEQTQTRVSEVQQERGHRIEQRLQAISERQEQISKDLGTQISEMEEKVAGMEIPEELPPRMVQHRFSFSLDATRNFWLFMSMFVVIAVQSAGLYQEWRPDRGRYDNDLKYRYVLMKGGIAETVIGIGGAVRNRARSTAHRLDAKGCREVRAAGTQKGGSRRAGAAESPRGRTTQTRCCEVKEQVDLSFLPQRDAAGRTTQGQNKLPQANPAQSSSGIISVLIIDLGIPEIKLLCQKLPAHRSNGKNVYFCKKNRSPKL